MNREIGEASSSKDTPTTFIPDVMSSKTMKSGKGLRKKARTFELEALEKYKIDFYDITDLDEMLNYVYQSSRPKHADYVNRRDLVRIFNEIVKELYGYSNDFPVVEAYGSFVMDMFSARSDLDLSVNFRSSAVELHREEKIKILQNFAKKLHTLQREGHITGIESILTARVPIVKATDRGTRIECDLSVENRDGILKSQLIHMISGIDDRFQKLSVLAKSWAKAHDINSSRDRTLNSLSIISLVAFHLQTRDPPILPPFSVLFKDGIDPSTVMKSTQKFLNWGKKNEEPLGSLFVTLLVKLESIETLWKQGLCVSLYDGFWISKKWDTGIGSISIEDFTDRSQNVARAVRNLEAKKIYSSIRSSINHLIDFFDSKTKRSNLKELLFGADFNMVHSVPSTFSSKRDEETNRLRDHLEHHDHKKRMRLGEGYRTAQANNWRERENFDGPSGKRMRYHESNIGHGTAHYIPAVFLQNPLRVPPSSGNVAPPMALRREYVGTIFPVPSYGQYQTQEYPYGQYQTQEYPYGQYQTQEYPYGQYRTHYYRQPFSRR